MSKFTQKYTIVQFLEKIADGTEYSSASWPLHVTIAGTFATDWNKNNLRENLAKLLSAQKPIRAEADEDEYFGPEKQTRVTVLKNTKELQTLHDRVIDLLSDNGAIFNDSQFNGDGFRPHATVQGHARINKGDNIVIDELTIVDMFPDNDPQKRKVLQTIGLSKNDL